LQQQQTGLQPTHPPVPSTQDAGAEAMVMGPLSGMGSVEQL
jgi:hypothetical protein